MPRRARATAVVAALAAALLVPAADDAVDPAPAAAQTTDATCVGANAPSLTEGGFTLPPWSDGGGWSRPELYETILSGDVDGDGWGELMGVNGGSMEVWTWAKGYNPYGHAYAPTPGQWTATVPFELPAQFPSATYFDPSRYTAFRLANIDKVPGDELVARDGTGIQVYLWSEANQAWDPDSVIAGPPWSDAAGWGPSHPDAYLTIRTGDVDGDGYDDLIGRTANGVETWSYASGTFQSIATNAPMTTGEGWAEPSYYATIDLADVDHDGLDELIARGAVGMYVWDLVGTEWVQKTTPTTPFPNTDAATGTDWTQVDKYESITVGDVDGDGFQDLVGRSAQGLEAWSLASGDWQLLARQPAGDPDALSDVWGWSDLSNATTVAAADVVGGDGVDEVIARGDAGVSAWAVQGGAWVGAGGTITAFSNDGGFAEYEGGDAPTDLRYSTIAPVTVQTGQPQMVIGRGIGGIETYPINGSDPSAPFPAYTDLSGTPAGLPQLTGPPDLSQLTPEGRAFWYLDAKAAQKFGSIETEFWAPTIESPAGPVTPARPTIVDQYRNVLQDAGDMSTFLDTVNPTDDQLAEYDPGVALNVARSTFNSVQTDVGDWTESVDKVRSLLGVGENNLGVKQLIDQGFVENATSQVDNIKQSFTTNTPKWVAWLSDLVWGLVGGIGSFSVFLEEGKKLSKTAIKGISFALGFGGSVAGAGAAYGISTVGQNPNTKVDAFADSLDTTLIDNFCASEAFVDLTHDQTVQDWGLLTSTRELVDQSGYTSDMFDDAVTHMVNSQDLWIWQQFASRPSGSNVTNWWVGVCDKGNSCSNWQQSSNGVWVSPENPNVSYRLVKSKSSGSEPDCGTSVAHNEPAFNALGAPSSDWSAPRQLDGTAAGYPYGNHGDNIGQNIGVNGWNLGTGKCD